MNERFTCEMCGGTFISTWSDDEARREAISIRTIEPTDLPASLAAVCTPCHAAFMKWFETLSDEDRARIRAEGNR